MIRNNRMTVRVTLPSKPMNLTQLAHNAHRGKQGEATGPLPVAHTFCCFRRPRGTSDCLWGTSITNLHVTSHQNDGSVHSSGQHSIRCHRKKLEPHLDWPSDCVRGAEAQGHSVTCPCAVLFPRVHMTGIELESFERSHRTECPVAFVEPTIMGPPRRRHFVNVLRDSLAWSLSTVNLWDNRC